MQFITSRLLDAIPDMASEARHLPKGENRFLLYCELRIEIWEEFPPGRSVPPQRSWKPAEEQAPPFRPLGTLRGVLMLVAASESMRIGHLEKHAFATRSEQL